MRKLFFAVAFIAVSHFGYAQQTDEALKKEVLKVIQLSGSDQQMKFAKDKILQMIPKEKQAAFIVEFEATLPSMYEKMAKVYMETYTKEEIKAMLAYYDSPMGKKIQEKSGVMFEKTMDAMQDWTTEFTGIMMKYMEQ